MINSLSALSLAAACVVGLSVPCGAQQQVAPSDAPWLFTPVVDVPAPARAWSDRERAHNPAIQAATFVRLEVGALRFVPGTVLVPVEPPVLVDLHSRERVVGVDLVKGRPRGVDGEFEIAVASDGVAAGTLRVGDEWFTFEYAAHADVHVLQTLDTTRRGLPLEVVPVDGGSAQVADVEAGGSGGAAESTTGTYLDVMAFYTPRARAGAGGTSGIETRIVAAIERANATNENSGVDARFQLVYVAETNYAENGSGSDLSRFRGNRDGYMDEVHALRSTYGGDLMHLITEPPTAQYCGVAYLMTRLTTGFRTSAFGVTLRSCMGNNVVAHEIGHNIGCHHDRANAGNAIYPYSYGFRTADNLLRTVMSYSPGTRVDVWSSPAVTYNGYVMGVANREDNARSIGDTKSTVSQFYAERAIRWCAIEGSIRSNWIVPRLDGEGVVTLPSSIDLVSRGVFPGQVGALVVGATELGLPLFGGTLVPSPHITIPFSATAGETVFDASVLASLPSGAVAYFQTWFIDSSALEGIVASDGLKAIVP